MVKARSKFSLLVILFMAFQLLLPIVNAQAAGTIQAPTNLSAATYSYNDVQLKWNQVFGAGSYRIYKIIDNEKVFISETPYTDAFLPKLPEGTITFAVSAVSGTTESTLSAPVSVTITYPDFQAPTGLTAKIVRGNDLVLSWNQATYATQYKVYQVVDGQRKLVATTADTYQTLTNLPEGNYTYEVTSYSTRFGESKQASTVSTTIVYPTMKPPAGLTSRIVNINNVSLNWETAAYATGYKVYQVSNGEKKLLATTSDTNYYVSNLPEGNYSYEVTSYSSRFGESNTVSQANVSIVYPIMQPPTGLINKIFKGNDISLSWDAAPYATEYKVYQVINGQRNLIATTMDTFQYFPNQPEGDYTYEITSNSNRFGESKFASQTTIHLIWPTMKPPTGLFYKIYQGNDLVLGWDVVPFATSYKIYRVDGGQKSLVATTTDTSYGFPRHLEGNFVYEVTSYSTRFGESALSSNLSVPIVYPKMLAPDLKLQKINYNNANLYWETVPYATSYNVYEIKNGEKVLLATTTSNSYGLVKLPEGTHDYVITSFSNRFGASPYSNQVTMEVGPVLEAPSTSTASVTKDTATLSWSSVQGSGSYNVYQVVDGQLKLVGTTSTTSYTLTNLQPGDYEFRIVSVSPAGTESKNYSTVTIQQGAFDTTPPVTTSNVKDVWSKEDVTVQLTATDDQSGVDKTFYSINGSDYTEGTSFTVSQEGVHTISFYSVDKAGNKEAPKTAEVKIDKTAPVTVSDVKTDWSKGKVIVRLAATDNLSGVDKTFYSIDGAGSVEGTEFTIDQKGVHKVFFYSVDKAGNVEEVKTAEVKIDETAPVTESDVKDSWSKENVAVNLTATDDLSGVDKTFYSIDGAEFAEGTSFKVSGEGVHKVSFYSVDKAGNVEEEKTVEVKIDETAPVTVSDVKDSWSKEEVTVNLTATDDLSGVAKTFYSINGAEPAEGTSFKVSGEGVHKVSFYSVDKAGNVEEAKTVEVKIDETAPVTVSDVKDSWTKEEVTVNLTATDNLSGVAKTFYSIDGAEPAEGTSFKVSGEGVHKVSFYSVDKAGNVEETKTVEVKIDETAPVTVSDVKDSWTKEEVTVNLTATDDLSGVAKTFYSIDGAEPAEGTSFKVSGEGVHKVSFYSVDKAGNVEEAKTVEVKIDETAPVTVSDVKDSWTKEEVTVNLTATDNLSGVAKTFYSIDGSEFAEGTSFKVDGEGVHKVSFYSVDKAGNKEAEQTAEVKIDKTAPVVSWNLSDEYALGTSVPVAYTATDALSGIAQETVTINGQAYKNGDNVNLTQPGTYKVVITATDNAGLTTKIEKTFVVYVPATIDVNPGVIKVNKGVFTVQVTVPKGFDTAQFDLSSATLNGVSANAGTNGLVQQAKKGQFKFNREDFTWNKGTVEVEFRALLNGNLVVGRTTVEVK